MKFPLLPHRALSLALVLLTLAGLAMPTAGASTAPLPTPTSSLTVAQDGEDGAEEAAAEPNAIDQGMADAKAGLQAFLDDPAGVSKKWAMEDGPRLGGKILLFLLILLISKIIANTLGRLVRGTLNKSKLNASELFKNFVENTVTKVVFFTGLVIALQSLGVNVAPLLAGIGVLGFVIGFALQDTLGNFAAGIMLLLYRPYDIGDVVTISGETGSVEAMSLVSTTLLTPDNQRLTIPNGSIWGSVIRNVTANTTRRITETIGIGYGDDIEVAERTMLEVVKSLEHVQAAPEPQVFLTELADSSVNFSLRAWVPTDEYFGTVCELRRQIKMRFDKDGISIPYPQQDVHMHEVAAG